MGPKGESGGEPKGEEPKLSLPEVTQQRHRWYRIRCLSWQGWWGGVATSSSCTDDIRAGRDSPSSSQFSTCWPWSYFAANASKEDDYTEESANPLQKTVRRCGIGNGFVGRRSVSQIGSRTTTLHSSKKYPLAIFGIA